MLLALVSIARAEVVDRIVAIVNDEIITQTDVDKYAARLKAGGLVDELLFPDAETKDDALKNRDKLLDKMVDERILDAEVKKQNMTVPIEQVEQEIRSIAKRNNVTREELKAALTNQGIDFAQYQDFIKTGLERQQLIGKAVTSKIKVSEDDVLSQFAATHGGETDQAFEYTLSHIYFSSDKGSATKARERAEKAYEKLRAGANFEQLAAEVSEDPGFETGGLLGVFKTGELQKDLESAISKLAPGEFTTVLPTQGGFHIVRVTKKKIIPDPRTEKERDKIRSELYDKAYKKQLHSWLDQLRQDAFVKLNK
jgi:peptidyl-prolyl cis-trans isomerase SurA